MSTIIAPNLSMLPFQINSQNPQEETAENELANFLKISAIVATQIDKVISNLDEFFNLSRTKTQFKDIPCNIFSKDDLADVDTRLNLVYTSKTKAETFHHEVTVLHTRNPQPFGFRIFELKKSAATIISFPNNKLFNVLLSQLPSTFSFAIQSTYQAIGEISAETHVTQWIESGSWPYDGDANDLTRIKSTYHDAHHIIRSIQSDHLLANILFVFKSCLKEKSMEQLFENNGARQLSNELEVLHNEASGFKTKNFYIRKSKIYCGDRSISYLFNGVLTRSEFPMKLKETQENYQKRCQIQKELFPYQQSSREAIAK